MTKRRITQSIILSAALMTVAGIFVGKEAWSTAYQHISARAVGCACVSTNISTWQGWAVLGFAGVFGVGAIAGFLYFVSTLIKTRRFIKRIRHGAENFTHNRALILKFKNGPCEAFTFGFFRPRIAVCGHCVEALPSHELDAMIEHEQYHMNNRDPLKFVLVDSMKYLFFFVPLIRTLVSWYHLAAELQADEQVQNREALGAALLKVAGSRLRRTLPIGASFASMIAVRIERIVNPQRPVWFPLNRLAIFLTVAVISGAGVIFFQGARAHSVLTPAVTCMRPIAPCRVSPAIDAQTAAYYNF